MASVSLCNTCVFSLLTEAPSCILQLLLQHHCSVTHTNGSVSAQWLSACVFWATQNSIICCYYSPLLRLKERFQSRSAELKQKGLPDGTEVGLQAGEKALTGSLWEGGRLPAKGENRLHSGTFLQTLQSAGHHGATFLIVPSKCSLDTLFKRRTRQTCATRHARRWWMISDIHAGRHILTKTAVYSESDLVYIFCHIVKWQYALCTAGLSAYINCRWHKYTRVQLLTQNSIISLCILTLWLDYTSEEKRRLRQKPPGSWHWISPATGGVEGQFVSLSVFLLHLYAEHHPWIDDAWPNSG